jgi:hypothetical protein
MLGCDSGEKDDAAGDQDDATKATIVLLYDKQAGEKGRRQRHASPEKVAVEGREKIPPFATKFPQDLEKPVSTSRSPSRPRNAEEQAPRPSSTGDAEERPRDETTVDTNSDAPPTLRRGPSNPGKPGNPNHAVNHQETSVPTMNAMESNPDQNEHAHKTVMEPTKKTKEPDILQAWTMDACLRSDGVIVPHTMTIDVPASEIRALLAEQPSALTGLAKLNPEQRRVVTDEVRRRGGELLMVKVAWDDEVTQTPRQYETAFGILLCRSLLWITRSKAVLPPPPPPPPHGLQYQYQQQQQAQQQRQQQAQQQRQALQQQQALQQRLALQQQLAQQQQQGQQQQQQAQQQQQRWVAQHDLEPGELRRRRSPRLRSRRRSSFSSDSDLDSDDSEYWDVRTGRQPRRYMGSFGTLHPDDDDDDSSEEEEAPERSDEDKEKLVRQLIAEWFEVDIEEQKQESSGEAGGANKKSTKGVADNEEEKENKDLKGKANEAEKHDEK